MGYDTNFDGEFILNKKLKVLHKLYLDNFSKIRHMKRNIKILPPDPLRELVDLSVGKDGEFFLGAKMHELLWNKNTHHLFTKELKKIVIFFLCLQKYHMQNIDKNIFYTIISLLAKDKKYIDFDNETNISLFYFSSPGFFKENHEESILDHNRPPKNQPGLWNQWVPNALGDSIIWNGFEKFYGYIQWIQYMIDNFFKKWGYILNGSVAFQGEESDDRGTIRIKNNIVFVDRM